MDRHLNYYEVRWKNFKGFIDTGWVKIKPITIILGENNSGKTNFVAPFLLMQQTITSRDANSALIVKGGLYDGGNIQELINDYDLTKEIYFGIRYHIHETDSKKIPKLGSHALGALEIVLSVKGNDRDGDIVVKKETISDVFLQEYFSLNSTPSGKYKLTGEIANQAMTKEEEHAILNSEPVNFLFSPDAILSNLRSTSNANQEGGVIKRTKGYSKAFSTLLDVLSYNYSRIRSYIGGLSYLGPIRENPHRIYEVSNESYNTVGSKGENMASISSG